ncbi:MAG: hypothetical protein A2941_01465 [Candidatus Yanofskybacteria bacterium RIFCSPLOWO2_01_FULL_49_17]|uniref:Uncharacterized protein n=1 Tax=Candidatus Yanofskybacteria bacterium RIFCSPLOWO2_01_FULL_49_17 TaxID=1802700 RepID=A0A1F8GT62_9BACT|nr:MAG: hypothetical protein A2941_01465 [Candidatus Yanofskybacteria bacterium RIFCSPLOWO2_01_FULL_49_17]
MENLTPAEQLQQVQQDYEKRRQNAPETEPEHESMSRVVQEQIRRHEPSFEASSHAPRSIDESMSAEALSKVQQLVAESFPPGKGLWSAIKEAKDSTDAATLDAFHAALTGKLYDELVASKQLKQVA